MLLNSISTLMHEEQIGTKQGQDRLGGPRPQEVAPSMAPDGPLARPQGKDADHSQILRSPITPWRLDPLIFALISISWIGNHSPQNLSKQDRLATLHFLHSLFRLSNFMYGQFNMPPCPTSRPKPDLADDASGAGEALAPIWTQAVVGLEGLALHPLSSTYTQHFLHLSSTFPSHFLHLSSTFPPPFLHLSFTFPPPFLHFSSPFPPPFHHLSSTYTRSLPGCQSYPWVLVWGQQAKLHPSFTCLNIRIAVFGQI